MLYLNHYLYESDDNVTGMSLYDYIVNVCDGEIDMDVSDKDIDMLVAFCHNVNDAGEEYPEMTRFLNLIAKRTKVVKQNNGGYAPVLVCDFSSALKPYNEQWKEFFDMDNSEFDEDEAYYEAVVNLEPLISGNAGESTYKEFCDIMEGKTKTNESATGDYWDAKELDRRGFVALLKSNKGTNRYLITNDANVICRFTADSDEEALDIFRTKKYVEPDFVDDSFNESNIQDVAKESINGTKLYDIAMNYEDRLEDIGYEWRFKLRGNNYYQRDYTKYDDDVIVVEGDATYAEKYDHNGESLSWNDDELHALLNK